MPSKRSSARYTSHGRIVKAPVKRSRLSKNEITLSLLSLAITIGLLVLLLNVTGFLENA